MIKRDKGFTLIELLIATTIFILAIAAIARLFITTAGQFKQQSKIAETYIEGMIGLEQLRLDIGHAGYGLPWNVDGASYLEAIDNGSTVQVETAYNDSTSNVPRAFVSGDGNGANGSDVLVVKAVNIAMNDASQKSTTLQAGNVKRVWGIASEDFAGSTDRLIIIDPGSTDANSRTLKNTAYPSGINDSSTSGFAPSGDAVNATYLIYDVAPGGTIATIRMPFNRADYYVRTPGTMPTGCAAGTGILYKATVNHDNGDLREYPLLDCVADMQVVYGLDGDENGEFEPATDIDDIYGNSLAGLDAKQVRDRVKEVRIYILAHEGQRDTRYTFDEFTGAATCATCIRVGRSAVLGRDFDISGITNFLNYRWKVYTLIVKPTNLK